MIHTTSYNHPRAPQKEQIRYWRRWFYRIYTRDMNVTGKWFCWWWLPIYVSTGIPTMCCWMKPKGIPINRIVYIFLSLAISHACQERDFYKTNEAMKCQFLFKSDDIPTVHHWYSRMLRSIFQVDIYMGRVTSELRLRCQAASVTVGPRRFWKSNWQDWRIACQSFWT